MKKVNVRHIAITEVFESPCFDAICDEYREECLRNPNLFGAKPDLAIYAKLEAAGLVRTVGAFCEDELVGMCVVLASSVPHFAGRVIASTETLFVSKPYRASKAGKMLISAAESIALEVGASGLYITAPVGGRLESLMPHVGYSQTNTIFYRGLK
ncbi:MAG: GNAT family N-acetyltransferase [Betaproteobacteria bacterium]